MSYSTSNTTIAAYLVYSQVPLVEFKRDGVQCKFVFEDVPEELLLTMKLNAALVEPFGYISVYKRLTRLARNNEGGFDE